MDATAKHRVARRAARALLDVTISQSEKLDRIEQELTTFENLLRTHPQLRRILNSPAVSSNAKKSIVRELSRRLGTSCMVSRLLGLLATRSSLALLPGVVAEFRQRLLDHYGIATGVATTAVPLDESQLLTIADRLGKALGRTVRLDGVVNPAIIGGVVARVGDTVYDGSIAGQLQRLKRHILEAALPERNPLHIHG